MYAKDSIREAFARVIRDAESEGGVICLLRSLQTAFQDEAAEQYENGNHKRWEAYRGAAEAIRQEVRRQGRAGE